MIIVISDFLVEKQNILSAILNLKNALLLIACHTYEVYKHHTLNQMYETFGLIDIVLFHVLRSYAFCVGMCVCVHACIHMCMYVQVYKLVYVFVYVFMTSKN